MLCSLDPKTMTILKEQKIPDYMSGQTEDPVTVPNWLVLRYCYISACDMYVDA